MDSEKFTNTSITIKGLLGLIEANDIAIPEIQRPFVWKSSQVRDLIDSLLKGYPIGLYLLLIQERVCCTLLSVILWNSFILKFCHVVSSRLSLKCYTI